MASTPTCACAKNGSILDLSTIRIRMGNRMWCKYSHHNGYQNVVQLFTAHDHDVRGPPVTHGDFSLDLLLLGDALRGSMAFRSRLKWGAAGARTTRKLGEDRELLRSTCRPPQLKIETQIIHNITHICKTMSCNKPWKSLFLFHLYGDANSNSNRYSNDRRKNLGSSYFMI